MLNVMMALHLLAAVFAVGPLAHAATTAARGLRRADARGTAESARLIKLYAAASSLAVVVGFGLASMKHPGTDVPIASMSEPWIWMSVLLWAVAVALAWFVTAPALESASAKLRVTTATGDTDEGARGSVGSLASRVAASGGMIGILLAVIVVLMVYKPGA